MEKETREDSFSVTENEDRNETMAQESENEFILEEKTKQVGFLFDKITDSLSNKLSSLSFSLDKSETKLEYLIEDLLRIKWLTPPKHPGPAEDSVQYIDSQIHFIKEWISMMNQNHISLQNDYKMTKEYCLILTDELARNSKQRLNLERKEARTVSFDQLKFKVVQMEQKINERNAYIEHLETFLWKPHYMLKSTKHNPNSLGKVSESNADLDIPIYLGDDTYRLKKEIIHLQKEIYESKHLYPALIEALKETISKIAQRADSAEENYRALEKRVGGNFPKIMHNGIQTEEIGWDEKSFLKRSTNFDVSIQTDLIQDTNSETTESEKPSSSTETELNTAKSNSYLYEILHNSFKDQNAKTEELKKLTEENQKITDENQELKSKNAKLQERIVALVTLIPELPLCESNLDE